MAGPGKHHGQRLGRTSLSITEAVDGGMMGGIAKQMISTNASHRHDVTRSQSFNGMRQRGLVAADLLRSIAE